MGIDEIAEEDIAEDSFHPNVESTRVGIVVSDEEEEEEPKASSRKRSVSRMKNNSSKNMLLDEDDRGSYLALEQNKSDHIGDNAEDSQRNVSVELMPPPTSTLVYKKTNRHRPLDSILSSNDEIDESSINRVILEEKEKGKKTSKSQKKPQR